MLCQASYHIGMNRAGCITDEGSMQDRSIDDSQILCQVHYVNLIVTLCKAIVKYIYLAGISINTEGRSFQFLYTEYNEIKKRGYKMIR